MKIEIIEADYSNKKHAVDIGKLLNSFALDPMGGGEPLSPKVQKNLSVELAKRPHSICILCYVDEERAGLLLGFEVMATFTLKPIINIQDIIVEKKFRGLKLSHKLLDKVKEVANDKLASHLSLEVYENNSIAKSVYEKYGFSNYDTDQSLGKMLYMHKILEN